MQDSVLAAEARYSSPWLGVEGDKCVVETAVLCVLRGLLLCQNVAAGVVV
jgi:hypothetical protein